MVSIQPPSAAAATAITQRPPAPRPARSRRTRARARGRAARARVAGRASGARLQSASAKGRSSAGRASVSKTECRRFESCRPCCRSPRGSLVLMTVLRIALSPSASPPCSWAPVRSSTTGTNDTWSSPRRRTPGSARTGAPRRAPIRRGRYEATGAAGAHLPSTFFALGASAIGLAAVGLRRRGG